MVQSQIQQRMAIFWVTSNSVDLSSKLRSSKLAWETVMMYCSFCILNWAWCSLKCTSTVLGSTKLFRYNRGNNIMSEQGTFQVLVAITSYLKLHNKQISRQIVCFPIGESGEVKKLRFIQELHAIWKVTAGLDLYVSVGWESWTQSSNSGSMLGEETPFTTPVLSQPLALLCREQMNY